MYSFEITNNYAYDIEIEGQTVNANGGTASIGSMSGNAMTTIEGMGRFMIMDLGDYKIPGYPLEETWGLLFRYRASEIYARYEGGGSFNVTIDRFGNVDVEMTNGTAIPIKMDDLELVTNPS